MVRRDQSQALALEVERGEPGSSAYSIGMRLPVLEVGRPPCSSLGTAVVRLAAPPPCKPMHLLPPPPPAGRKESIRTPKTVPGLGSRVWLFRHAQVHESVQNLAYGDADVPLSCLLYTS
ncbi:MAG: hypothetical protein KUG81_04270, partial [Gammaproteobacteria bacterium]|nr:hypothetical protein [Gammaproteobacteria bacterium]